jgi:hypothetical protein
VGFAPLGQYSAVLLAGNGHVRSDIGVPYWLRRAMAAPTMASSLATGAVQVQAVGYVEPADETAPARFDQTVVVPPVTRPDPCATLKMPTR